MKKKKTLLEPAAFQSRFATTVAASLDSRVKLETTVLRQEQQLRALQAVVLEGIRDLTARAVTMREVLDSTLAGAKVATVGKKVKR